MRVTAIGGVPASGKTTLVRKVIEKLAERKVQAYPFKEGLVVGTQYPEYRLIILGVYLDDREVFAGTDRLSMAAQPAVLCYLAARRDEGFYREVIFEGDRLFNGSLFEKLDGMEIDYRAIVLSVPRELQVARFALRGSDQPEKFLKAKATKVQNIIEKHGAEVQPNGNEADLEYLANYLLDFHRLPF